MASRGRRSQEKAAPAPKPPVSLQSSDPNVQPYLEAMNNFAGTDAGLGRGLLGGAQLGSLMYGPGSMGRVNEDLHPEEVEIYNRLKGESFLGGNQTSADTTNALNQLRQASEFANPNNALTQQALGDLKSASQFASMDSGGVQTGLQRADNLVQQAQTMDPRLGNILDARRNEYNNARTLDPNMQNLLSLREQGLQGLNSAEMMAAREQGQSELNRAMATSNRALAQSGLANGGPRGNARGITALPNAAQFAQAQGDLERKLILDNYNAKQQGLNSYGGLVQDIDNNNFNRAQATLGAYSQDASTFNQNQINNQLNANNAYNQAYLGYNQNAQQAAGNLQSGVNSASQMATQAGQAYGSLANNVNQFNIQDRASRLNNFVNYQGNLRTDLYNRNLENLNRIATEKAGMASSIFSGGAFASSQIGQQQSFDLAKENLDLQKSIWGSGGRSSGGWSSGNSGTTGSSTGSTNSDSFG